LDDPEDFVRLEIAAALERGIRVIPVLVGGAPMPSSSSLPDTLQKLARRHALTLPDTGFQQSVSSLIETIDAAQEQREREAQEQREREQQNADAMYRLGYSYQWGYGVKRDYQQGRQWYEKAAAAGSTKAMNNLGLLYENGYGVKQDYQQARQWYEKLAAAGNVGVNLIAKEQLKNLPK
jgi:TPR repeat protein